MMAEKGVLIMAAGIEEVNGDERKAPITKRLISDGATTALVAWDKTDSEHDDSEGNCGEQIQPKRNAPRRTSRAAT
jgi:hypothetical protein